MIDRPLDGALPFQIADDSESFVVLGANMTSQYREYNDKVLQRAMKFFDLLERIKLNLSTTLTLARLSGFPKLIFYASVTPPQHARDTIVAFQNRLIRFYRTYTGIDIPDNMLHERHGAGIPDYATCHDALFEKSRNLAFGYTAQLEVELVTCTVSLEKPVLTAHLLAQHAAEWMFATTGTSTGTENLSDDEFRICFALRCQTLPKHIIDKLPTWTCECGNTGKSIFEVTQHALACQSTRVSYTTRHNAVRNILARAVNEFGLTATKEPTFYTYTNGHRRPDLTVYGGGATQVTTDVIICAQDRTFVGAQAAANEKIKRNIHHDAVSRHGHSFVPFCLETHGHRSQSVYKWIQEVSAHLPRFAALPFERRVKYLVSTTLAKNRAMIMNSLTRTYQVNT